MKFWSNFEKEYNDLFEDGQNASTEENQVDSKMESDLNDMLSDIKKDLKNVPKEDLLPGLTARPGGADSESEDEDGDFDLDESKKAMKNRNTKRKRNTSKLMCRGEFNNRLNFKVVKSKFQ